VVHDLRRDAYMRFGALLETSEGEALLRRCLSNVSALHAELTRDAMGMVQLIADDPIIELELEPRLKVLGGYYDYGRNREILQIPLVSFLALVVSLLGVGKDETFVAVLEKVLADQGGRAKFEAELAGKAWADKSEGGKVVHFLKFLAGTFAEKPAKLVGYLKPILGAQKYESRKR